MIDLRSAVSKVNKNGVLLIYPIKNAKEPNSLWQELFPRKKMRWEWDENGDQSVSDMWFLRERLSTSRKVVYCKWYQGRATVFSNELYKSILRVFHEHGFFQSGLRYPGKDMLEVLEENSPQSTKQLKRSCELSGRENEARYNRALKDLFNRFLIVGFGEVDEGAFPSLAIGSTRIIFEDLWNEALEMDLREAQKTIDLHMPQGSLFRKFYDRVWSQFSKSL